MGDNEIINMQTQLSFHEDSIQTMSDIIARQQKEIDNLKLTVRQLQKNMETLNHRQTESPEDNPPPHY